MARTTTWPSVRRCGVCGRERKISRAAVDADPDMCAACWRRDPRSWRECGRCGELRPGHARIGETGQPICERCYRHTRPVGVCDRCGATAKLWRTGARGGPKLCGACRERERPKRTCGRCGRVAAIAVCHAADGTRDLCFACYGREPRRLCGGCGELAAIQVRGRDGKPDLCQRCHRPPTARCSVCGREQPCSYAATDAPVCWSCKPRRIDTCVLCGQDRPVKASSLLGPICGSCEWRRLRAKSICERCGQRRRPALHPGPEILCGDCAGVPQTRTCTACAIEDVTYYRGLCPGCSLRRRLEELRAEGPSAVIERLEPYLQTLDRAANPLSVLQWLAKPRGRTLADIARGEVELSHEALDTLDRGKSSEHLRAELVHAGVLPVRDEILAALKRWTTTRLAAVAPGPDRTTLRTFATWKIARELAGRRARQPAPDPLAATMPKRAIGCAVELTAWLHHDGFTLADLDQPRLDQWLSDGPPARWSVRRFVAWLERNHTRGLRVPSRPPSTAVLALDDRDRLHALRNLLEDQTIDAHLRLAGCLVALYAQPAARIVRLTATDLQLTGDGILVWLGRDPVPLPQPLRTAAASVLGRATSDAPWLFPGLKAGHPMHPAQLANRLKQLGVPIHSARSSALAALVYRIPAPVLADVLGFSAQTTANASAELKVDYAGYVARR